MTNLNLTGGQSAVLAVGLAVAAVAAWAAGTRAGNAPGDGGPRRPGAPRRPGTGRRSVPTRCRTLAPYLAEAAVVAALYAVWQWLAGLGHGRLGVAVERGETLLRWQRDLHLPDELALQRAVLAHPWLVQLANLYYAIAHFTVMGLVLVWLFVRHRDRYPPVRTVLIVVTAACLAVSFVAVAPPRLLPGAGFVDTAAWYGQSVYAPLTSDEVRTLLGVDFGADQLSAMPSVHVAWALLVALAVQWAGTARARVLIWAHPVVTVLVIVVTANHYWADGIVAAALLTASVAVVWAGRRAWRRHGRGVTGQGTGGQGTGSQDADVDRARRPEPVNSGGLDDRPVVEGSLASPGS